MKPLLSTTEAAAFLGVHPKTVHGYARNGYLKSSRLPGGDYRFTEADLEAFTRTPATRPPRPARATGRFTELARASPPATVSGDARVPCRCSPHG